MLTVEYWDPFGKWSLLHWHDEPREIARAIGGVTYGPNLLRMVEAGGEFNYRRKKYRVFGTAGAHPRTQEPKED